MPILLSARCVDSQPRTQPREMSVPRPDARLMANEVSLWEGYDVGGMRV